MLPYLTEVKNPSKKYSVAFRGLNYGEGAQDGEFAETHNLSTDQYPCITQRAARIAVKKYNNPSTIHAKGNLLVIAENAENKEISDVFYGETKVGEVTSGKKQTATIGNYIVIFPDKKYYRVPTEDDKDGFFGSMEEELKLNGVEFTASTIKFKDMGKFSFIDFTTSSIKIPTEYTIPSARLTGDKILDLDTAAFPFKVGDIIDISGCSHSEYNIKGCEIVDVDSEYIQLGKWYWVSANYTEKDVIITCPNQTEKFRAFRAGDKITIAGCLTSENNKEVTIKEVTDYELIFDEGTFVEAKETAEISITRKEGFLFKEGDAVTITGCSEGGNNKEAEIIIRGVDTTELTFDDNAFTEATETGDITIKRSVPDLDFICESNYRLWGTHGNTIYSSKFSDPFNFKVFDGLSSDSYAIEVGSEGEFTGCIPYSSHICFFKENTLHKVYGTKPSNFQVNTVNVYGVQSGSERSMHIVNEQLLYKGVGGVYSYTGGVPELISEKFGNKRYSEAVASCDGEKYYISMKQGETWNMFAYDVARNIWLREDDTHAVDMTFYDGQVYYLDAKGGLYYIDKTADRNDIEWGATFCTMHETINERKGYSKFHLRMDMSEGAWLAVDIKTDYDHKWRQIYTTHNEKAKTVSIPIIPTRCDSIGIRLRGKGKCTIKTFIREFSVGSDV